MGRRVTSTTLTAWERTGPDARAPFHLRHVHRFDPDDPRAVRAAERLADEWVTGDQAAGLRVRYLAIGLANADQPDALVRHVYTYTEGADTPWTPAHVHYLAQRTENPALAIPANRRN